MHDLNYFRDHLDVFAEVAKKRGAVLDLDEFRALDKERRELITETEALRAQRNKASDEIGRLKKENLNADALIAEMKAFAEPIKVKSLQTVGLTKRQEEFLLTLPHLPHPSLPLPPPPPAPPTLRPFRPPPHL